MTIDETRQLAIEFERRVNAVDPSTESVNKLDTDTIYAYLNQFQMQYIQQAYASLDQVQNESRMARKFNDAMKTLITHKMLAYKSPDSQITTDEISDCFQLPSDYFMYIRSNSAVTGTYKDLKEPFAVSNIFVKQDQIKDIIQSYYNDKGIIRNPLATLTSLYEQDSGTYLQIIHDVYTKIHYVELVYYRMPNRFNVIDNVACELPYECFDDIVSGAVALYLTYRYTNNRYKEVRNPKREPEEQ